MLAGQLKDAISLSAQSAGGKAPACRPGGHNNRPGPAPVKCYLPHRSRPFASSPKTSAVNLSRACSCIGVAAVIGLSGCASIISGRQADVAFDSVPSNARVVIRDKAGRQVAQLTTPGVVSLKRNRRFFMPAYYTADIEAAGYMPAHVPIPSTINPWILGNVLLGGIPGLVVDTATGAAWKPRDSQIHQQLAPLYGRQPGAYSANGAATYNATNNAAEYVADESSQPAVERR